MSSQKKVLVLGGNGFIGTNLCKTLVNKGHSTYSFDRVLPQYYIDGVQYVSGDFFDDTTLNTIVTDMDVIIHAISTINPGNSSTDYMRGYQKDFIQTIKLLELAEKKHIKLIFLSSGGTVYGKQEIQPITETALPHPINHYGNVKLCIENTILTFASQSDMDIVIARLANPYGPGQDYRKGVGFIDAVIRNAISGNAITIYGDGSVVRDYIYIDDVCGLLTKLVDIKLDNDPIINICSGIGISNNDILDITRKIHGDLTVNYIDSRSVDLQKVVLDNTKINNLIEHDYCPLETGIRQYYNFIKNSINYDY